MPLQKEYLINNDNRRILFDLDQLLDKVKLLKIFVSYHVSRTVMQVFDSFNENPFNLKCCLFMR